MATQHTTPDYEASADLSNVSEADRVTFTTRTNRSNGVPIRNSKTVTADTVTVEERDGLESVEVEEDVVEYREVEETHIEVVAIEDDYRYTFKQTDDGTVRVSSCKQSDWVDQHERAERNAVARSNVSHGYITSWEHNPVATDGGVVVDGDDEDDDSTTRRTRKDIEYLADVFGGAGHTDPSEATDGKRNARLIDHGWLSSQGRPTGNGRALARTTRVLQNRDEFADAMGVTGGVPGYVDVVTSRPTDALDYLMGLLVVANLLDESRHQTDTQSDEYDHDGYFAPHFADYNARGGSVEVRFKTKSAATEFFREWCPDRFDSKRKHDERFASNRNPKRIIVTVV